MAQTLSHTAVLQACADDLWEACKHVDGIFCYLLPECFAKVEFQQGHGEPGSTRLVTTGPAIKHARFLKERTHKFDDASKTLGYTVLERDSRYSAFSAEIQFVAKDADVTEATWTATFVPVGDMGPPEHIKAMAERVFQTLEKAVHMKKTKTFTHVETLDVSPDTHWTALKHGDEILLEQMPQHGGPGTVPVIKFASAVEFEETVKERVDFIDKEEKRMGYCVATIRLSAGPSAV